MFGKVRDLQCSVVDVKVVANDRTVAIGGIIVFNLTNGSIWKDNYLHKS